MKIQPSENTSEVRLLYLVRECAAAIQLMGDHSKAKDRIEAALTMVQADALANP